MSNILKQVLNKPICLSTKLLDLTLNSTKSQIHTTSLNLIKQTTPVLAEPTKAKKRIDPAVLALRENRKKKRLEKEIKKLERFGRKLKPIDEVEPDRAILKEAEQRKRKPIAISKKEMDDEYFLKKEWSKFINQQHNSQMEQLERALKSQQEALKELKKDNIALYNMAIQLDTKLIPYMREGPVHTPPNKNYEPPEGDYYDVTYLYDRR